MEDTFNIIGRFVTAIIMLAIPVFTTLSFVRNMDMPICFTLLIFSALDAWFLAFVLQDY